MISVSFDNGAIVNIPNIVWYEDKIEDSLLSTMISMAQYKNENIIKAPKDANSEAFKYIVEYYLPDPIKFKLPNDYYNAWNILNELEFWGLKNIFKVNDKIFIFKKNN